MRNPTDAREISEEVGSPPFPEIELDEHYMQEVTDFYLALRGTGLILSPLEAELVLQWHDEGIPLNTVLRAMHRGAEKLQAKKQALRSLRSLKRYVRAEARKAATSFRARGSRATGRDSHEGLDPEPPTNYDALEEVLTCHLTHLDAFINESGGELDARQKELFEKTAAQLKTLAAGHQEQETQIVTALLTLGRNFYEELQDTLSAKELEKLNLEAEAALRGFETHMSEEARSDTLKEVKVGLLREQYGLFEPGELLKLWE